MRKQKASCPASKSRCDGTRIERELPVHFCSCPLGQVRYETACSLGAQFPLFAGGPYRPRQCDQIGSIAVLVALPDLF